MIMYTSGIMQGFFETGSNKLYIENSNSTTPLIYGDFDYDKVGINADFSQNRVGVGITTSTPKSSLDVSGSVGMTFKSGLEAGTTHPDETGTIWRYNTVVGTVNLPDPTTCANRMYIIINQTGSTINISDYRNLGVNITNTVNTWSSIEIVSDGVEWWQVK